MGSSSLTANKKFVFFATAPALIALVSCMACKSPDDPQTSAEFSKMEIHYTAAGGWIPTSQLDIFPNGQVKASLFEHGSYRMMENDSTVLDDDRKNGIADLFRFFPEFRRNYNPPKFITDQDHHRIIFKYNGYPDTVDMHMPFQSDIPGSLRDILLELNEIWDDTLE